MHVLSYHVSGIEVFHQMEQGIITDFPYPINWRTKTLQASVTSLLLIVSAVLLTTVVIDYAVNITEAALQTKNIPQVSRIKDLENNFLNQTNGMLYPDQPIPPNSSAP